MSNSDGELFICSFCEQQMKITAAHIGRRTKCPKCARAIFLHPNRNQVIDLLLTSTWYYQRPRLLFGSDRVGPITDEHFVQLVRQGDIDNDFEVSSPEFTRDEAVVAARINLSVIQEQIDQRVAERERRFRKEERKRLAAADNKQRLIRAVTDAVSDGQVSLRERDQLFEFARAAKIPGAEVESLLRTEARRVLDSLIDNCLADGILDEREKQCISEVALGLGQTLNLTNEQTRRLQLCELAFRLAHGKFSPEPISIDDVAFNAGETPFAHTEVSWHEIVKQKKPTGAALGDGHYLKEIAGGDCVLTDKRILLIDRFTAKKVTLASIERVRRYRDGVFCQRSTGKSIFLRWIKESSKTDMFALLLEYAATDQPVLGLIPSDAFIPDSTFNFEVDTSRFGELEGVGSNLAPRYTFRVVGDHIGDRSHWIERIGLGEPVSLLREPTNPYDTNAVAVLNPSRHQLGYLKREVASWFGPMLDRGFYCRCQAYRKPSSGGLIVAVFND